GASSRTGAACLAGGIGIAHPSARSAERTTRTTRLPESEQPKRALREHAMSRIALIRRRDVLALGAAGLCASLARSPALAQAKFPERPIKLVVPFVAGGVNDTVARLWADKVK